MRIHRGNLTVVAGVVYNYSLIETAGSGYGDGDTLSGYTDATLTGSGDDDTLSGGTA